MALKVTRFRYKTKESNSNELILKEIRIPVEEGPSYRRGQFYLDIIFNGQNGIHDCHEYEEKLLPFMRKHTLIEVHNCFIYSMHRWSSVFMTFIRRNGDLFPLQEIPYAVGDIIVFERELFEVDWIPTRDGRIYLFEQYKNKIDIYGAKKVDIISSKIANQLCYYANTNKRMYFSKDDTASTVLVHRYHGPYGNNEVNTLILTMNDLSHTMECYYVTFRNASRFFTFNRVGDEYEAFFTLPVYALVHIKKHFNIAPLRRTRRAPFEYSVYLQNYGDLYQLFGAYYFRKKDKGKNTFYIEPITLDFSVISRRLVIKGKILREDGIGDIFGK